MQEYTIKPRDTLYLIAKEFNIPLAQLIKANPQIVNPEQISIGQTILIPNMPDIPEPLGVIESESLGIIDDIYQMNWDSAGSRVNRIRTAVNAAAAPMREAEVPGNLIFELNSAVRMVEQNVAQRRAYPAISQANRLTQLLADVLDYFSVLIPTDVLRLAYFARQIIINVEQNDWAEAYQNYRRALNVWERTYPDLQNEYLTDITEFNQTLATLETAVNRQIYQGAIEAASRMLQLVDEIASDFSQQNT